MKMKLMYIKGMIAVILAFSYGSIAHADTMVHASTGMPFNSGASSFSYTLTGTAITNTGSSTAAWVIPLTFSTYNAPKTITIVGRAASAGALSCNAIVVGLTGSPKANAGPVSFAVTSGYAFNTLTLPAFSDVGGAFGSLICSMAGNVNAYLIGIMYVP
jgi:hypothetical protein